MEENPPTETQRFVRTADPPAYHQLVRGDAILSRNLFDSATGPLSRTPSASETAPTTEAEETVTKTLKPCENNEFRLEATVAMESNPALSMAAVSGKQESEIYHVGDSLADGRVAWISWQYLIIDNEEDYCYLDLFDKEKLRPKQKQGRLSRREIRKGIKADGRYRRVVKRDVFERLLGDPGKLMRGIKVRPYRKGKKRGYKIRRVRRSHPAYLLGLRKNDVVRSVNGQRLADVGGALAALGSVRHARNLKVELIRKGKQQELDIHIN